MSEVRFAGRLVVAPCAEVGGSFSMVLGRVLKMLGRFPVMLNSFECHGHVS
ncbi:MAG: hypothetical protein ACRD2N_11550 [Vicinamibacterales bacterium]